MAKVPSGLPVTWPPDAGLPNGVPWWVKVGIYFGVPTLFAAFLIWFVTATVAGSLDGMSQKLNEHVATTNFYLFQLCLNTAQTEVQARGCYPPTGRP